MKKNKKLSFYIWQWSENVYVLIVNLKTIILTFSILNKKNFMEKILKEATL